MRMRVPGVTSFSTTSVGELKNTMESLSAPSTSATAIASTPSAAPMRESRRCLRVIAPPVVSTFQAQAFDEIVEALELGRIVGERTPGIAGGGPRLVGLAEDRIGAHQSEPSLDVGAVVMESLGETLDHAADHGVALLAAELGGGRNLLVARAGASVPARAAPRRLDARQSAAHEI